MNTVHFSIVGILHPFTEQVDANVTAVEEIVALLNTRIREANILVDGKHPVVKQVLAVICSSQADQLTEQPD